MDKFFKRKILYFFIALMLVGGIFSVFISLNEKAFFGDDLILGLRVGMSRETVESTIATRLESNADVVRTMRNRSMKLDNFWGNKHPKEITEIDGNRLPPSITARISELYAVNVFLNQNVLMIFKFFDRQLYGVEVFFDNLSPEELARSEDTLEKLIMDKYKSQITSVQNDPGVRAWNWERGPVKGFAVVFSDESPPIWLESANSDFVLSSNEFKSASIKESL